MEVHWSQDAEAYVTPVSPELVGVAVLSATKGGYDDQLRKFPALLERLPIAEGRVRGAGPLRRQVASRVLGRVLLVGDAAGYVDALTGEGIAVSLKCSAALVDCVARDDPASYEAAWVRVSRRYRWLTESLLWASRQPLLRRSIVPLASGAPLVFRAAVNQLAH